MVTLPKYQTGSDCSEDEYDWTSWQNADTPDGLGDWEMATAFGENDVCSNPIGAMARQSNNTGGFLIGVYSDRGYKRSIEFEKLQ